MSKKDKLFDEIIEDLKEYEGDGHITDHLLEYLHERNKVRVQNKKKTSKQSEICVSDQLLAFVSGCLGVANKLPKDPVSTNLTEELLRPSVASYFRHGEAEASMTAKGFADKFREVEKELRASRQALRLIQKVRPFRELDSLIEEADELIRIFFRAIRNLENKLDN